MSDTARDFQSVDIFFGEISAAAARVYAQWRPQQAIPRARLAGSVTGPYCELSRTLRATVPLVDRGPGVSLVAEAVVPDPCVWTPDLPLVYRVEVRLIHDGETLAAVERTLGIRPLAPQGKRLMLASRRWVARIVDTEAVVPTALAGWREAGAVCGITAPLESLLKEASTQGVLVMATTETSDIEELRRLARWPAVGVIVLSAQTILDDDILAVTRNVIFGQCFEAGERFNPQSWAQLVLVEGDDAKHLDVNMSPHVMPVFVYRRVERQMELDAARADCDRLQRDVAGVGDFSGYAILGPKE